MPPWDLLFHWCSFYIPLVRPELHFGPQDEYSSALMPFNIFHTVHI